MRRNPLAVPQLRQTAPQYRFWGSQKPPEHRDPVKAQVTSNAEDLTPTAVMRIYGPIDSWGGVWGVSAAEVAAALDELPGNVSSIELHLNSPGGEVYEGIAILNLLRQHDATVTAYVDGLAASAASFIATGADETVMGENSQLMIHDAWGIVVGPAADMHQMGDLLDKISGNIAGVYQGKAGGTIADWRAAMLAETWYDAQEAVDLGLADRVHTTDATDESGDAQNAFDLSMFKHQGREDAPPPPTLDLIAHDSISEPMRKVATAAAEKANDLEAAVAAAARARLLALRSKRSA